MSRSSRPVIVLLIGLFTACGKIAPGGGRDGTDGGGASADGGAGGDGEAYYCDWVRGSIPASEVDDAATPPCQPPSAPGCSPWCTSGQVCCCGGPTVKCECDLASKCSGGGYISRRAFKTDIDYVDDQEREALAQQALRTRLAEYRYKAEPASARRHLGFIIDDQPDPSPAVQADRTHVDEYGYTSMLLATVQQQQKEIDALRTRVDALQKKR